MSTIEPLVTYCCIVWDSVGVTLADNLQKLQDRVVPHSKHSVDIRRELGWFSLREMREQHTPF